MKGWVTKARFALAWFIMPPDVKALTLKPGSKITILPKAPTPLWTARRASMLEFGYDPRDTATP